MTTLSCVGYHTLGEGGGGRGEEGAHVAIPDAAIVKLNNEIC